MCRKKRPLHYRCVNPSFKISRVYVPHIIRPNDLNGRSDEALWSAQDRHLVQRQASRLTFQSISSLGPASFPNSHGSRGESSHDRLVSPDIEESGYSSQRVQNTSAGRREGATAGFAHPTRAFLIPHGNRIPGSELSFYQHDPIHSYTYPPPLPNQYHVMSGHLQPPSHHLESNITRHHSLPSERWEERSRSGSSSSRHIPGTLVDEHLSQRASSYSLPPIRTFMQPLREEHSDRGPQSSSHDQTGEILRIGEARESDQTLRMKGRRKLRAKSMSRVIFAEVSAGIVQELHLNWY